MSEDTKAAIEKAAEEAAKAQEKVVAAWNTAIDAFASHIKGLPDNPDISSRVGKNSFIVSSCALAKTGTWSIFTQDFLRQRDRILDHARKIPKNPEVHVRALEGIVADGTEKDAHGILRYHHSVVAASKSEILAIVAAAKRLYLAAERAPCAG